VDRKAHEELETLTRRYIVYLLERNLKSVDFINALKKQDATPLLEQR
jgi:hypothetical protein